MASTASIYSKDDSFSVMASGAAQQLPARHFPAFSACGRVGGGFRVEGSHSNAHYNRHIRHHMSTPTQSLNRPYSSTDCTTSTNTPYLDVQQDFNPEQTQTGVCHSSALLLQSYASRLSPEVLNAAAQASLAAAQAQQTIADMASTTVSSPATGVEGIGYSSPMWHHSSSPSSSTVHGDRVVQQALQPIIREALLQPAQAPAAAAAGSVGDYSAMQEYLQQHQQQQQQQEEAVGPMMPTTFCKGLSTGHGTWQHDGTDFTSGHLEQVLPESWKRRPGSAPARQNTGSSVGSSRSSSSSAAAAARPKSSRNRYVIPNHRQEQQQQLTPKPLQGPLTPELQRLMDSAQCSSPSRDSWYCYTPVEVLKIEREQQRAAEQQWLSEFNPTAGAKYPQRPAAVYRHMRRVDFTDDDDSNLLASNSSKCAADGSGGESVCSAVEGDLGEPYACVDVVGSPATTAAATAADTAKQPAWWEADEKLARLVRLMLQPSFAQGNPKPVQTNSNTAHNMSTARDSNTAHSSNTAYSRSSFETPDRSSFSQTLGVYDGLVAANAVRAADIGEQMALYESSKRKKQSRKHASSTGTVVSSSDSCRSMAAAGFVPGVLQTPEERHAVWVAELAHRSVLQRQQQILLEAAVVAAAS